MTIDDYIVIADIPRISLEAEEELPAFRRRTQSPSPRRDHRTRTPGWVTVGRHADRCAGMRIILVVFCCRINGVALHVTLHGPHVQHLQNQIGLTQMCQKHFKQEVVCSLCDCVTLN